MIYTEVEDQTKMESQFGKKWSCLSKPLKSMDECKSMTDQLKKYDAIFKVVVRDGKYYVLIPIEVHERNIKYSS